MPCMKLQERCKALLGLRVWWRHRGPPGEAEAPGLCARFPALLALFVATFPLATWKGREKCVTEDGLMLGELS